jgi:glycerol uptake facilitator protein
MPLGVRARIGPRPYRFEEVTETVQDRGLAAYIAELVGTLFLVCTVVILYVSTGAQGAQFGSDFAAIGLVHGFVLFALIAALGGVSGGHFNPAVTVAAAFLRRIDPVDAVVYVLAQLSGGVLGALLAKGLLLDEGRATDYGAPQVSSLLGGNFDGMVVEAIGTFLLVLAVCAVALNPRVRNEWAPLAIGLTLGFAVIILGPLTGAGLNPARWFGPALIGETIDGSTLLVYVLGPLVGAFLAALFYRFVIATGEEPGGPGSAAGAVAERKPGTLTGDVAEVETAAAEVEDEAEKKK